MKIILTDMQCLFLLCLLLLLLFSLAMFRVAANMKYTRWGTVRKLSILDLGFPSSVRYYSYIMTSIVSEYEECKKKGEKLKYLSYNLLKYNLYLDFLFIWPAYGAIAIMCFSVSGDTGILKNVFIILAYAQSIALIMDVIENIFILRSLKKPKLFLRTEDKSNVMQEKEFHSNWIYSLYKLVVGLKWLILFVGLTSSAIAFLYNFSFGYYDSQMKFIGIICGIFVLIILILMFPWKKKSEDKKELSIEPMIE